MRALCIALPFVIATSAVAQDIVPSIARVIGVAEGDVLNMRAGPDASDEIVGAFPPDADGIEITAYTPDGRWARVNADEWSGWVAARFLAPSDLPTFLSCFGTEPFWSIDLYGPDGGIWSTPEGEFFPTTSEVLTRTVDVDMRETLIALYEDRRITVTSFPAAACSDGMSDKLFALGASAIIQYDEGWGEVWSGCCTMVAD